MCTVLTGNLRYETNVNYEIQLRVGQVQAVCNRDTLAFRPDADLSNPQNYSLTLLWFLGAVKTQLNVKWELEKKKHHIVQSY